MSKSDKKRKPDNKDWIAQERTEAVLPPNPTKADIEAAMDRFGI